MPSASFFAWKSLYCGKQTLERFRGRSTNWADLIDARSCWFIDFGPESKIGRKKNRQKSSLKQKNIDAVERQCIDDDVQHRRRRRHRQRRRRRRRYEQCYIRTTWNKTCISIYFLSPRAGSFQLLDCKLTSCPSLHWIEFVCLLGSRFEGFVVAPPIQQKIHSLFSDLKTIRSWKKCKIFLFRSGMSP